MAKQGSPCTNDDMKSYQRMEKAGLKGNTAALIIAKQEQALSNKSIETNIYNTRYYIKCRMYKR